MPARAAGSSLSVHRFNAASSVRWTEDHRGLDLQLLVMLCSLILPCIQCAREPRLPSSSPGKQLSRQFALLRLGSSDRLRDR